MKKPDRTSTGKRYSREMTVAHIRTAADAEAMEVIFLESARFYKLFKTNPTFDTAAQILRQALSARGRLKVGLATLDSDEIESVEALDSAPPGN